MLSDYYGTYPDAGYDETTAAVMAVFLVMYLIFILAMLAFVVAAYILQSLGMYTIAKRRGINNPWLSWIPVGNMWILGSISDQYQYVAKGRVTNRRKVLLGLELGAYGTMILMFVVVMIGAVNVALNSTTAGAAEAAGMMVLWLMLLYFAMLALLIVWLVFAYMAYYDLYTSCNPANATLYLVLSILFSVTLPFFVFACRKKDLGMPPRKPAAQPQQPMATEPVFAPVADAPAAPEAETAAPQEPVALSEENAQQ